VIGDDDAPEFEVHVERRG